MGFIRIEVRGLNELLSNNDRIIRELPNTRRAVLTRTGTFLVDELKRNAHVVTGRMQGSVNLQSVTDEEAIVSVPVPYAETENRRPGSKAGVGPHNFGDRALLTTEQEGLRIAQEEYDKLFMS